MSTTVPTVLVTGANSGIGQAAVAAFVANDARIVATVRSAEAARELRRQYRGAPVTVAQLDVTDAATAKRIASTHRPDVIVNSAGDALLGAVMDIDDDQVRAQFEALVIAPIRLARLAVQSRQDDSSLRIINVSSMVASTPIPFTGWYGAAKAGLDSVTDALRLELSPLGIDVVRIECGAVKSAAWDSAGELVEGGSDESTRASRHRWRQLTDFARPRFADPAEVGIVIAEAALSRDPRPIYRVGFGSHVGLLSALVPARLGDELSKLLFGLRTSRP